MDKYVVLDTSSMDAGMFAAFSTVLGGLHAFDKGKYAGFNVNFCNGRYSDPSMGCNWWEYYFDPINIGEKDEKHIFTFSESLNLVHSSYLITRNRAFELINKYIYVKAHIQKKVNAFWESNFKDHFVIGIHHRGTDKETEYELVPYEITYKAIQGLIEDLTDAQRNNLKLYIATDDQQFICYIIDKFPLLIIYNNFVRSSDKIPLHDYNLNGYNRNYQKGEEALIDCLLLSKCDLLIRPSSNLSIVAGHFNPNMRIVVLPLR